LLHARPQQGRMGEGGVGGGWLVGDADSRMQIPLQYYIQL